MLKKDEMFEILSTLEFDSEAMGKLIAIIEQVEGDMLDADTLHLIKLILLEEEEKSLNIVAKEVGVDTSSVSELQNIDQSYQDSVHDINNVFEHDMRELDDHLETLKHADVELVHITETIQVSHITDSLKSQ